LSFNFPRNLEDFYHGKQIKNEVIQLSRDLEIMLAERFKSIEKICEYNQMRVLEAFKEVGLSDTHFSGSSGYGYDDSGREKIESAFAYIFGAEKALVRNQISSGTQAIASVFFGILRPGDTLLSVTGKPYDTLNQAIGLDSEGDMGSLKDFGINYREVDFDQTGNIDYQSIESALDSTVKIVFIQKSKGYSQRKDLLIDDIESIVNCVRKIKKNTIVMVDNCYGEFTEIREPCHAGVDICAGSLIKNPGGGICLTGGYIAGREDLVEKAASRLSAPGVGSHTGPSLGMNRMIAQGLFFAPHTVSQAMKGAVFAAALFEKSGFSVKPGFSDSRGDIVQTITFGNQKDLISFCQSIQNCSPVDSFVNLLPWDMPGYSHKVIMAAGNFVQGSSSELSCDAPVKPPYTAYMQGGLVYDQIRFACMVAASKMGKL